MMVHILLVINSKLIIAKWPQQIQLFTEDLLLNNIELCKTKF